MSAPDVTDITDGTAAYIDIGIDATGEQERAIVEGLAPNSVLNIESGPGTGKTKTICNRVAYLLSQGVHPSEIAIISFANVNVDDLTHSLNTLIGATLTAGINISTIHSLAQTITLNKSPHWQIIRDINCLPNNLVTNIIKHVSILTESQHPSEELKKISAKQLSDLKATNLTQYIKYLNFDYKGDLTPLASLSAIYDKSIIEATKMLKFHNNGETDLNLPPFISNLKEIIVDEYQDTKKITIDFVLELAKNKHLTVSGDLNQAIFNTDSKKYVYDRNDFNRNDINIPAYIKRYYNQKGYSYKSVTLSKSFRFNNNIKDFALGISKLKPNIVDTIDEISVPIVDQQFDDIIDQFDFIFKEIHKLIDDSKGLITPKNVAILGHTNNHLHSLKTYFENKKSKYLIKKLKSHNKFIDSKLSVILTFLKLIDNPLDNAIMIVIMYFLKGIGIKSAFSIYIEAEKNETSIYEILKNDKKYKSKIIELDNILQKLDRNNPVSIMQTFLNVAESIDLKKIIKDDKYALKLPLILKDIYYYAKLSNKNRNSDETTLHYLIREYETDIFQSINLVDEDYKLTDEAITISTIHSAKGFEWDIVFILSNMDQLNYRNFHIDNKLKYVALTRSRHMLYHNRNNTPEDQYHSPPDIHIVNKGISQGNSKILENLHTNISKRNSNLVKLHIPKIKSALRNTM